MRKLLALCLLGSAVTVTAGNYRTGTVYSQLIYVGAQADCTRTIYDPDVFQLPDSRLIAWGQAVQWSGFEKGVDSLYTSIRGTNGVWNNPTPSTLPTLTGRVVCNQYSPPDSVGPLASPSIVKVGAKYFMAYVGGNADLERGRVYWGSSTDGLGWQIMGGVYSPAELIAPAGTNKGPCDKHGIGQVQLAYEAPYFYFFLNYYHYLTGAGPQSSLAYRIKYSATESTGLSSLAADRQIYQWSTDSWVPHNGQLLFDYQGGTLGISPNYHLRQYDPAQGDVEYDAARGKWIHMYVANGLGSVKWQETTSLANGTWTTAVPLNMDTLRKTTIPRGSWPWGPVHAPAMTYADVTNDGVANPSWYLFTPIQPTATQNQPAGCGYDPDGNPNSFSGLALAVSALDWCSTCP